ncbi:DUF4190 domain-containing protein [bacterium AH-315-E10]|nr:DUF4190 domain-containing protein [bacterium AH-315-E10]
MVQTSNKAISSLLFSLLGLFCLLPFIGSLIGIVLGHLAKGDIKHSNGKISGEGLALSGLITGYIGILIIPVFFILGAAMMLPVLSSARDKARQINDANNLKQIGLGLIMSAGDKQGQFPDSTADLIDDDYMILGKIWICPASQTPIPTSANQVRDGSGTDYVYLGKGASDDMQDAYLTVLMHTKPDLFVRPWMNFLFVDGHVEGLPVSSLEEAVAQRQWLIAKPKIVKKISRPKVTMVRTIKTTRPPPKKIPKKISRKTVKKRPVKPILPTIVSPVLLPKTQALERDPAKSWLKQPEQYKLPATLKAVAYNRDFLLIKLHGTPTFHIFDIANRKWQPLNTKLNDAVFAMNANYIYLAQGSEIECWKPSTAERVSNNTLNGLRITTIAAGNYAAQSVPLLVHKERSSELYFIDAQSLKPTGRMFKSSSIYGGRVPNLRLSPNGNYATIWRSGISPEGVIHMDLKVDPPITASQHATAGLLLPGNNGFIYTNLHGVYKRDNNKLQRTALPDSSNAVAILPAVDKANKLLLAVNVKTRQPTVRFYSVKKSGDFSVGPTFNGMDEMKNSLHPMHYHKYKLPTLDWRILYFKDHEIMITLPYTNNRMAIRSLSGADIRTAHKKQRNKKDKE